MVNHASAKAAFKQRYSTTPWNSPISSNKNQPSWPFLEELVENGQLSSTNYLLTCRLFKEENLPQESMLFLCHLILAIKEGHLCIHVDEGIITPSIQQIWKNQEDSPLSKEDVISISQMAYKGSEFLLLHQFPAIHIDEKNFYLKKYWDFESQFLIALKAHMASPPKIQIDNARVIEIVENLCEKEQLQPEQGDAIIKGCQHPFLLISGGPGTGKTYTTGQFIKIFWSQLNKEQQENFEIVLTAPTGKAAANLHNSLLKAIEGEENFPSIQAKTIHSLLGIKSKFVSTQSVRLTADLLFVDESSMLDIRLAATLLTAIKPGSRLILLGDQHQLPSVDAGSLFADLTIASQNHPSQSPPSIQLNKCLRTDIASLVQFAQSIRKGNGEQILHYLRNEETTGINLHHLPLQTFKAQQEIIQNTLGNFIDCFKHDLDEDALLAHFQSFRLLSPLKHGPFGYETINQLIWERISKNLPQSEWIAVPIMIIANDHKEELFNGDTGILIRKIPLHPFSLEDYALFQERNGQRTTRKVPVALLPRFEYAYCLSVHKSQGSEFDHVSLVLPLGASQMGREVLYTAVTRARKQIDIYTSDEILLKTIEYQARRQSGIAARLNHEILG